MKDIFIVLVINRKTGERNISQDAYSKFEDAAEFCSSRYCVKKVDDLTYVSKDFKYCIHHLFLK